MAETAEQRRARLQAELDAQGSSAPPPTDDSSPPAPTPSVAVAPDPPPPIKELDPIPPSIGTNANYSGMVTQDEQPSNNLQDGYIPPTGPVQLTTDELLLKQLAEQQDVPKAPVDDGTWKDPSAIPQGQSSGSYGSSTQTTQATNPLSGLSLSSNPAPSTSGPAIKQSWSQFPAVTTLTPAQQSQFRLFLNRATGKSAIPYMSEGEFQAHFDNWQNSNTSATSGSTGEQGRTGLSTGGSNSLLGQQGSGGERPSAQALGGGLNLGLGNQTPITTSTPGAASPTRTGALPQTLQEFVADRALQASIADQARQERLAQQAKDRAWARSGALAMGLDMAGYEEWLAAGSPPMRAWIKQRNSVTDPTSGQASTPLGSQPEPQSQFGGMETYSSTGRPGDMAAAPPGNPILDDFETQELADPEVIARDENSLLDRDRADLGERPAHDSDLTDLTDNDLDMFGDRDLTSAVEDRFDALGNNPDEIVTSDPNAVPPDDRRGGMPDQEQRDLVLNMQDEAEENISQNLIDLASNDLATSDELTEPSAQDLEHERLRDERGRGQIDDPPLDGPSLDDLPPAKGQRTLDISDSYFPDDSDDDEDDEDGNDYSGSTLAGNQMWQDIMAQLGQSVGNVQTPDFQFDQSKWGNLLSQIQGWNSDTKGDWKDLKDQIGEQGFDASGWGGMKGQIAGFDPDTSGYGNLSSAVRDDQFDSSGTRAMQQQISDYAPNLTEFAKLNNQTKTQKYDPSQIDAVQQQISGFKPDFSGYQDIQKEIRKQKYDPTATQALSAQAGNFAPDMSGWDDLRQKIENYQADTGRWDDIMSQWEKSGDNIETLGRGMESDYARRASELSQGSGMGGGWQSGMAQAQLSGARDRQALQMEHQNRGTELMTQRQKQEFDAGQERQRQLLEAITGRQMSQQDMDRFRQEQQFKAGELGAQQEFASTEATRQRLMEAGLSEQEARQAMSRMTQEQQYGAGMLGANQGFESTENTRERLNQIGLSSAQAQQAADILQQEQMFEAGALGEKERFQHDEQVREQLIDIGLTEEEANREIEQLRQSQMFQAGLGEQEQAFSSEEATRGRQLQAGLAERGEMADYERAKQGQMFDAGMAGQQERVAGEGTEREQEFEGNQQEFSAHQERQKQGLELKMTFLQNEWSKAKAAGDKEQERDMFDAMAALRNELALIEQGVFPEGTGPTDPTQDAQDEAADTNNDGEVDAAESAAATAAQYAGEKWADLNNDGDISDAERTQATQQQYTDLARGGNFESMPGLIQPTTGWAVLERLGDIVGHRGGLSFESLNQAQRMEIAAYINEYYNQNNSWPNPEYFDQNFQLSEANQLR